MDREDWQYFRIKDELIGESDVKEFQKRLEDSQIRSNPFYLGLLLMTLANSCSPKVQFIRSLISRGANPNFSQPQGAQIDEKRGRTVLMTACQNGVAVNVNALLSCKDLNAVACDNNGETALMYCFRNKNIEQGIEICKALVLKHPSLINHRNKKGQTPLAIACWQGKLKMAQILLNEGADPNIKIEPTGSTVLQIIISASGELSSMVQKQAIIILLSHGADPYLQDDLGENSFDYAEKYLFDLEELQEVKANTEPTQLTNNCISQTQSFYQVPEGTSNNRLFRDFGDIKDEQQNQPIIMAQQKRENQNEEDLQILQQESSEEQQLQTHQKFEVLSQQIWSFNLECQKDYQEAWSDINQIYTRLCQIANDLDLKIQIVGSFATGLWTPYSDIDIIFINQKNSFVDLKKLLCITYDSLVPDLELLQIDAISLHQNFKVPFIKIQLEVNGNLRIIEVCIFQRKSSGRKYVKYIRNCLQNNQLIRPTFFIFHRILQSFGLHLPYKNGLKTYTIFLMIYMAFQIYPPTSLGQGLYNFVYYFAVNFNYEENTMEQKGKIKQICSLNIIDPLNQVNNVGGRDTDVKKLIQMFKIVFYGFGNLPNTGFIEYILQLCKMTE